MSVSPGTGAVVLPRFHVTTFGPPLGADSTLAEVAEGQLVVPARSSASALKTYSPRSRSVHDQTKFTPAPPAGTFAMAGLGPVHVASPPPTLRSDGDTFVTATLLFTFSVTLTTPACLTMPAPTVIAVSRIGGPSSWPGTAGVGTYGP